MAQITKTSPRRAAARLVHWIYPSHRQVALIVVMCRKPNALAWVSRRTGSSPGLCADATRRPCAEEALTQ